MKQILFKHIETAPRDILQGYPRLSRDEALNLINQTQKKLEQQYGTTASEQLPSTASSHTAGFGMYRDRDQNVDRLQQDEEKGGIPCLFDVPVPKPRELVKGG